MRFNPSVSILLSFLIGLSLGLGSPSASFAANEIITIDKDTNVFDGNDPFNPIFDPGFNPITNPGGSGSIFQPDPGFNNNGGYNYGGSGGYGNPTGQPNMTGVDVSQMPEIKCALLEDRPYLDLTAAITNLRSHVNPQDPCLKDSNEFNSVYQNSESLKTAAASIVGMWHTTTPDMVAPGTTPVATIPDMNQFNQNLQALVSGFAKIGDTLGNTTFTNSKCGKKLSTSGILSAVGDVATAIAPFALLGASLNPQWSLGLKFVMGLTGAGSVAKIMSSMKRQSSMDMTNPQNRMAFLLNTCEYFRIQRKMRFFNLVKAGKINEMIQQINDLKRARYVVLTKKRGTFSAVQQETIGQVVVEQKRKFSELAVLEKQYQADSKSLSKILTSLGGKSITPSMRCTTAMTLLSKTEADKFPNTIRANFIAVSKMNCSSDLAETLLSNEESVRTAMLEAKAAKQPTCATDSGDYLSTLNAILFETLGMIANVRGQIKSDLGAADPAFKQIQEAQDAMAHETATLSRVAEILQKMKQPSAVIDASEANQQMNEIQIALFGASPSWMPFSSGDSPALGWLKHTNTQQNRSITKFKSEFTELAKRLFADLTPTGKSPIPTATITMGADGGWGWYVTNKDRIDEQAADMETANFLIPLTATKFPIGTDRHRQVCQHLQNAAIAWTEASDHFAAQTFLCRQIEPIFDTSVDPKVRSFCTSITSLDTDERVKSESKLQNEHREWEKNGLILQAKNVLMKIKKLQCENEDPISAMGKKVSKPENQPEVKPEIQIPFDDSKNDTGLSIETL